MLFDDDKDFVFADDLASFGVQTLLALHVAATRCLGRALEHAKRARRLRMRDDCPGLLEKLLNLGWRTSRAFELPEKLPVEMAPLVAGLNSFYRSIEQVDHVAPILPLCDCAGSAICYSGETLRWLGVLLRCMS